MLVGGAAHGWPLALGPWPLAPLVALGEQPRRCSRGHAHIHRAQDVNRLLQIGGGVGGEGEGEGVGVGVGVGEGEGEGEGKGEGDGDGDGDGRGGESVWVWARARARMRVRVRVRHPSSESSAPKRLEGLETGSGSGPGSE